MGHAKFAVLISRNWYGGYRCRFGGLLVPPAPLPLTTARVGAGTLVVFGDYQIAPIAARSTAMGRWRLTPPWYWGDTACGRDRRRKAPHPSASLTPVSLRVGRFAGLTRHRRVIQHRGPIKGEYLGGGIQHREHPGGKLKGAAGVQRKFTVFLQNLKVELRKASML